MYGQPLSFWQRFMLRFQATPTQMAEAELKAAELDKLAAISQGEYARLRAAIYEITATYHEGRITRLKEFLGYDVEGPMMAPIDITELVKQHGDYRVMPADTRPPGNTGVTQPYYPG